MSSIYVHQKLVSFILSKVFNQKSMDLYWPGPYRLDKISPNIPSLWSYRELKQCGKDEKASSILQMKEPVTKKCCYCWNLVTWCHWHQYWWRMLETVYVGDNSGMLVTDSSQIKVHQHINSATDILKMPPSWNCHHRVVTNATLSPTSLWP